MSDNVLEIVIDTPEGPLRGALAIPPRPMRLPELAFGFLEISSKLTELEIKRTARDGRPISCRKGCSACCRHLVPLSPPEAWLLADLVASMPSARQGEVRASFAAAVQRIAESPLQSLLEGVEIRPDDVMPVSIAYQALDVACPFLRDESCSIYPYRPSICREFAVTSPAESCSQLGRAPIDSEGGSAGVPSARRPITRLPVHVRLSDALSRLTAKVLGTQPEIVPLPFALEWANEHREEAQRSWDARTLMEGLLAELRA